jgi:hypothetical protein
MLRSSSMIRVIFRAAFDAPSPRLLSLPAVNDRRVGGVVEAELGERLDRTQEVAGSSPASSTRKAPASHVIRR